ncbi:MAG: RNA polymerase sigma factor [Phycicoccus sp.]
MVLHHIADLSVHQIATDLGVPEGTVKARLSRGRAALASVLAPSRTPGGTHV